MQNKKHSLYGVIVGEIAGSTYEFNPQKNKEIPFFKKGSKFTDDTVMTLAIANAFCDWTSNITELKKLIIHNMVKLGEIFPDAGYGGFFRKWLKGENNYMPYNSFGNGSAMRVGSVCFVANSLNEAEELAKTTAEVTHNHEEGIKGAMCIAGCMYLLKTGASKEDVFRYAIQFYSLNFTLDQIRPTYAFEVSCQNSVPQAITAFLESASFEDAIQNAISLGGDSDTIAAMCGGLAGLYYGTPIYLIEKANHILDNELITILTKFEQKFIK